MKTDCYELGTIVQITSPSIKFNNKYGKITARYIQSGAQLYQLWIYGISTVNSMYYTGTSEEFYLPDENSSDLELLLKLQYGN